MSDETMRIVVEQVGSSTDASSGLSGTSTSPDVAASADNEEEGTDGLSMFDAALMAVAPELLVFKGAIEKGFEAFDKLKTHVLDFAQKIEQFAPSIQVANAQRDVTMQQAMMQADIRAGDEIGELIKVQAQADANLIRIDATLNKQLAKVVRPLEEIRNWLLDKAADLLESMDEKAVGNLSYLDMLTTAFAPIPMLLHQINEITKDGKLAEEQRARMAASTAGGNLANFFKPRTVPLDPEMPVDKSGGAFGVGI